MVSASASGKPLAMTEAEVADIVERDLLRTFPKHPFLSVANERLIPALRRVLLAFAAYHPHIGYCQSLNFLAALLLLHGDEAGAFALLATLCESLVLEFHTPDLRGLHQTQASLLDALARHMPALSGKLTRDGVPVREQTTHWLLCLFVDALPMELVLRLWDLLFFEGQQVISHACVALFYLHETQLLAAEELYSIKPILKGNDADVLVRTVVELLESSEAELS
ncbi:hypothetical protein AB1Y20_011862 [Prymnesium parvum]|uniref:Rab-GAP TBC domain-containing protein n=1 Tax=Prymnesium parvum TaxID=97485 RepID=A0AB34IHQ8_PRYPA